MLCEYYNFGGENDFRMNKALIVLKSNGYYYEQNVNVRDWPALRVDSK